MTTQLIALAGPLQGTVFSIESPTLTLGRHSGNDLVVRHLSVSRHHGRMELESDGYRLIDLDSFYGTYVNDGAIKSRLLADGDRVTLGESLFLFHSVARSPAVSLGNEVSAEKRAPALSIAGIEEASTACRPALGADSGSVNREATRLDKISTPLRAKRAALDRLVGESTSMEKLRAMILKVADVASTVLIDGESGCGKEKVARVIHEAGSRRNEPFVAVNCATLSETLLESELFGHEKGAFTGAVERRVGQFERAHGGTLFLDEIGEIPLLLQAKLLRVLQERELERLGGRRTIQVDVRVLAATNRDLKKEMEAGRFRGDLFYRLDVIRLTVSPLRERREDIPLLTSHFLFHHARRVGRSTMALSRQARAAMVAYPWPGNVRELSNVVERAVVLAEHCVIQPEDLPETLLECRGEELPVGGFHKVINAAKRDLIRNTLKSAGGNVTRAARQLDLSPNYLHRLMTNLGLRDGGSKAS